MWRGIYLGKLSNAMFLNIWNWEKLKHSTTTFAFQPQSVELNFWGGSKQRHVVT